MPVYRLVAVSAGTVRETVRGSQTGVIRAEVPARRKQRPRQSDKKIKLSGLPGSADLGYNPGVFGAKAIPHNDPASDFSSDKAKTAGNTLRISGRFCIIQ